MKKYNLLFLIFLILFSSNIMYTQIKNPKNIPFNWKTDTTKSKIDLAEITMVLPRHSFPTINYPKFINKTEGLKSFFAKEPVMAVEVNGIAKGYPLNMLTVHEISNDTISGIPILATYCPLCNSGVVYDRRLNFKGKDYLLEFEVSGMLRKSDIVMADKQTESFWQQLIGTAIVGQFAGAELKIIPSLIISVEEFFNRYPDGLILSKNTGNNEIESYYGQNFYKKYDSKGAKPYDRYFNNQELDKRIPPMERVVDVTSKGRYKIYTYTDIATEKVLNDEFNSKKVVLFYQPGSVSILDEKDISKSKDVGMVTVFSRNIDNKTLTFRKDAAAFKDDQTNSTWDITGKCIQGKLKGKELKIEPGGTHFAFAWLAFHPDTEIFKRK